MKRSTSLLVFVTLLVSLACQLLFPATTNRDGTIISACTDLVGSFREVQPEGIPPALLETGIKQGNEFDVNAYFDVFTHIFMEDGYILDYVYQMDFLGAFPILYARPVDQPAYNSTTDLPADPEFSDYSTHISVDDSEQGYFEYVALLIMARQFYLSWHANYNDTEIVCSKSAVNDIIADINDGDFGLPLDLSQRTQARSMADIEPLVRLIDDTAVVELVIFTKWGGFYRTSYTISRSFPHSTIDVTEENIVPYDCGVAF